MSNRATPLALNISEQTLKALQTAGQIFPGVAIAANMSLEILQVTQSMKRRKEDFITIGRDSCTIMEIVIQRVQVSQNLQPVSDSSMLRQDADALLADMRYIKKCVKRAKRRSTMGRIFNHQADQDTIQECRERLTHARSLFGLRLDIEIWMQLASICNQLAALLGQLSPPLQHSQQPQSQWQIPCPSFPATPSPQTHGSPISTIQYNQSSSVSVPAPAVALPTLQRSQESAEHAARMNEIDQQQMNMINQKQMNVVPLIQKPTGFSAMPGFSIQNPLSGAGTNSSYVAGSVNNVSRDGSFNVAGSGNSINFSFAR